MALTVTLTFQVKLRDLRGVPLTRIHESAHQPQLACTMSLHRDLDAQKTHLQLLREGVMTRCVDALAMRGGLDQVGMWQEHLPLQEQKA
jgi:hypothetical protein